MSEVRVVRAGDGHQSGGQPWLFKAVGSQTSGQFEFMVGPVAFHSGPPLHSHAEQTDTFYVLEGVLTVQAEDQVIDLGPGDFISVPPGTAHTFDNVRDPDVPVVAINIMTPSGLNEYFADLAKLGSGPRTAEQRAALAVHGVSAAGPAIHDVLDQGAEDPSA